MDQLNVFTELAVDPDDLQAIYVALDEAGMDVEFVTIGGVPRIEVSMRASVAGFSRDHRVNLTIEESTEHARDRLNDAAAVEDALAIADRLRWG